MKMLSSRQQSIFFLSVTCFKLYTDALNVSIPPIFAEKLFFERFVLDPCHPCNMHLRHSFSMRLDYINASLLKLFKKFFVRTIFILVGAILTEL